MILQAAEQAESLRLHLEMRSGLSASAHWTFGRHRGRHSTAISSTQPEISWARVLSVSKLSLKSLGLFQPRRQSRATSLPGRARSFRLQSSSLEEKRTEEWWKELVQPSTVLAGEAEVKEADLTDPRGVVTECSGKAGFEAPVDTDRGAAATKWGQIARAKSWDEVRAPLAVYRFSGVQLDEDPRRTGEYRAPEA